MKKHLTAPLLLSMILLSACSGAGGGANAEPPSSEAPSAASPAFAVSSVSIASGDSAYRKITAEDAKKLMEQGSVTIVDVRTPEEYAEAHVPGAVNIPNEDIGSEQPEALPDQEAALIVYCRTGRRSKEASDKLLTLGYKNISDMGGIVDWTYETESGETPG